jgi:UDP-N-acetylmuramate: L-alanyl-gamma-D-glutamyl-meso-diaminopimelate ligase
MNNLEFDHADIFRDLADVQRTFVHLSRIVPRHGWILLNGDDENLRALGDMPWTQVLRVGEVEANDVRIANFREDANGAAFALQWRGTLWAEVSWSQPGFFNARNAAMAAVSAALALHPDEPTRLDLTALSRFRGVKRRQELRVDTPALKVIEDFGHHPTALAETLQSFRARFPGHAIHAAFEPRSNTSRTKVMQAGFMRALALADAVYLGAVARSDKLKAEERFDADAVIAHLAAQGVRGCTAATNAELLMILQRDTALAGDRPRLVVFFSNGSFDGIIGRYVAAVRS